MHWVDLRSDTVTRPSSEMRKFMMEAEVGDDVFGEDPTINRLQKMVAQLTGKEAALFVPSGTQGNEISVHAHTQPGQEIIVERFSHIVNYESGAPAMLAGVQVNPIDGIRGIFTAEQVAQAIRPEDDHYPQTGLICIENTHNRAGGTIFPLEEIKKISRLARKHHLKLHLDGARLWNASAATGISIKEYCSYVDSVMLSFSKGLGAPVGSIVAGTKDFIRKAHFYRKAYGGGMRQAGILAAAAIYAIEHNLERLPDDHLRTRQLAQVLQELDGFSLDMETVQTNILIFDVHAEFMTPETLVARLKEKGILMLPIGPRQVRAVFHFEVTDEDLNYAIHVIRELARHV